MFINSVIVVKLDDNVCILFLNEDKEVVFIIKEYI